MIYVLPCNESTCQWLNFLTLPLYCFHTYTAEFWYFDLTDRDKPVVLTPCQRWIQGNSTNPFGVDDCKADVCPTSELFVYASGWRCWREDPAIEFRYAKAKVQKRKEKKTVLENIRQLTRIQIQLEKLSKRIWPWGKRQFLKIFLHTLIFCTLNGRQLG